LPQAATGAESSVEDCERLIDLVDTDGDRGVSLDEFIQLVREGDQYAPPTLGRRDARPSVSHVASARQL
jgi:hypothetical protein